MKLKLLLIAFVLTLSTPAFSQVEAFPVPDIFQCNDEGFDLTVQTPIVLGNQDPTSHSVHYYTTLTDASNGTNEIEDPEMFVPNGQIQEIFVKVQNEANDDFDITSFTVEWGFGEMIPMDDVYLCEGGYTLPALPAGQIYVAGPNGMGGELSAGDVITTSQYIFIQGEGCSQGMFFVGIGIALQQPDPIGVCDANEDGVVNVDLWDGAMDMVGWQQNVSISFHETPPAASAGINPIANPENYTNTDVLPFVVYVRLEHNISGCVEVVPIQYFDGGCTGNTISGTIRMDADEDGCTPADVVVPNVEVYYVHGNNYLFTYTDANGYYSFDNVPNGTIYVSVSDPMFDATPATIVITTPGDFENTNFCLTEPEPLTDVAVVLMPSTNAQPGFMAYYFLMVQNLGNQTVSGTVTLEFDDVKLDFLSSSIPMTQSGNTLTFNYSDLEAFQNEWLSLQFQVMLPGVTDMGDVLAFVANVTPTEGDANTFNNQYTLNHIVTNSLDPNDILVREGEFITEEQADGYLHYTVRFQNIGDANAIFVRIENELHANLDASTFEPLATSHPCEITRDGDYVEFFFDDIQLAGAEVNEPESHGFVIYRIKPKSNIQLGESMTNDAMIYFDFNDPIETNTVTTTVQALGVEEFSGNGFGMYPNPASGKVSTQMLNNNSNTADVTVTDMLGKTVINTAISNTASDLDISRLGTGLYLVTVSAEGKSITKKLVVK